MKRKLSEEDLKTLKSVVKVFRAIDFNAIMNAYAIENVIFGDLKAGEKIPFDKFVEDLDLTAMQPYSVRDCISGIAITENETIADGEIEFFEREFHLPHELCL